MRVDNTAKTSPYDYVTSVVYPACAINNTCCVGGDCGIPKPQFWWDRACTNEFCYGVPMFRQLRINANEPPASIKMAGQSTYQRSTMAPNNGKYYIDTTVSLTKQKTPPTVSVNEFREGQNYYLFLLYAKPDTTQTYQIYVGDGFDKDNPEHLWATRATVTKDPYGSTRSPRGPISGNGNTPTASSPSP